MGHRGPSIADKARTARAVARAVDLSPIIAELQAAGITSLNGIAAALTERGIPTPAGSGHWYASQVARVLRRLARLRSRRRSGIGDAGMWIAACGIVSVWPPTKEPIIIAAMPNLDNARYWRERTEAVRVQAELMPDSEAKRHMLGIASSYELLALRAQERAKRRHPSEGPA
jgi:hypothetical protein